VRYVPILLAGAAFCASPAVAADALKFGPPPNWVVPQALPKGPTKAANAPAALLLKDEQVRLEPGKTTAFTELAFKLQTPDGLSSGNLALPWQPATDTITINKLHIIRGDKVIDVLAGQSFTVARRETNLDAATLDGSLTAVLQPEGLQVGDIVDLAITDEHVDPVMKNHVEGTYGDWNGMPIELAHARLIWPSTMKLVTRQTDGLPQPVRSAKAGENVLDLSGRAIEPLIAPKGAPERFQIGRWGEATDFQAWSDVSDLMLPLYRQAAVIPASGPLRDELETIRKNSADPKTRAEQALRLVQDRVRYVALEMGTGGYVPAAAETTWSRRFGDCKGKTALLLALLGELGVKAEPVLVHHNLGDILPDRLPMLSYFDHVLVRAHIGAKDYWLDGTRTGDTDLDTIEVPDFGWGLPLVGHAQLVQMVPAPLAVPNLEHNIAVDATAGVLAPATMTIEEIYRGDTAVALNTAFSALTQDQRDEGLRQKAKSYFDDFTVSSSAVRFDKQKREFGITIRGTAKLNWKDGWAYVPTSSIAFTPDFDRPAGPFHDVPWSVDHPRFVKDKVTIRLPAGFAAQQKIATPVHETLAGVEYQRSETVNGDVLTVDSSERSIAAEVPYKQALAAAPRLKALDADDVYIHGTGNYVPTQQDIATLASTAPVSADDYAARGNLYVDGGKYDEAIADFTQALKLEPDNKWALAGRGIAHVWKRDFDEARKDLDAAEARDPGSTVVLHGRGLMAELQGDCAKAVDFYTKSLAKGTDAFALGHRATCEYSLAKQDEALADSAQVLKSNPSWMALRVLRANIFKLQGKDDLVAAEAEALVRDNPKSDYAWVAAGKTYAAIGKRDKAMDAFDHALAIKPLAYIYLNRAQARPFSDTAGRVADLDAALKLEPDNTDVLAEKAEELATKGDYKAALQLYDQVVRTEPKSAYYAVRRAVILFKTGDTNQAKKLLDEQRSKAKGANDFNNLCWTKATAGILLDEALEDCHQALKLAPDIGGYIDSLAFVELRLGKVDEAIADYDRAIAKKSGAASYMGRAIAYAWKGDKTHADVDLAQALKMDSNEQRRFEEFGLKLDRPSQSVRTAATPSVSKR
jgi:tetratricopeptide (TPR) repeat protein